MKNIRISDITMKQATETISLSFREKIELSKLLDKLGVSVIELEGMDNARQDALRIKSIAAAVRDSIVAVPVALDPDAVGPVWNALSQAKHPRLQVCAATSPVQMEYLHRKKPEAMLTAIEKTVAAAAACCTQVEFVAEDATRSDPVFLVQAIEKALEAGASMVTLCDAAGTMLPGEFTRFINEISASVPGLAHVDLGVSCADTLSMADACSIAALCGKVTEVKAAAYPAGSANLSNVARVVCARAETIGGSCPVHVTQLSRILGQITRMCQTGRSKTSPFDSGVREEEKGLFLTAHDDAAAVARTVEHLGYDLSDEDNQKVYEAFQNIASKKEQVSIPELDAIVASAAMQVPPVYQLDVYSIQSGNTFSSTAHLRLKKEDEVKEGVCIGDGPIDAAFLAIEQITGCHYELDDFQIQAVTEGREAMGQTVVKLLSAGKLYSGRGISTDIVGASIRAYLNALNKIVYEEEEQ